MRVKVKCPNAECGMVLVVDGAMAGKKGKCSKCGSVFTIPAGKPKRSASGTSSAKTSGSKSTASGKPAGTTKPQSRAAGSAGKASQQKPAQRKRPATGGATNKPAARRRPQVDLSKKPASRPPADDDFISPDEVDDYLVEDDELLEEEVIEDDFEVIDEPPARNTRGGSRGRAGGRASRNRPAPADDYEDFEDFEDPVDDYDEFEDDFGGGRGRSRGGRSRDYDDDFGGGSSRGGRRRSSSRGGSRSGGRSSKKSRRSGGRVEKERAGVGLILLQVASYIGSFAAVMVFLAASCLLMALMFKSIFFAETAGGLGEAVRVSFYLLPFGWATSIVGYVFTMLGPDKNGIRGLSITCIVLQSIRTLAVLLSLILSETGGIRSFGFDPLSLGLRSAAVLTEIMVIGFMVLGLVETIICAILVGAIADANGDRWGGDYARQSKGIAIGFSAACGVIYMMTHILRNSISSPDSAMTWFIIMLLLISGTTAILLVYYFRITFAFNSARNSLK